MDWEAETEHVNKFFRERELARITDEEILKEMKRRSLQKWTKCADSMPTAADQGEGLIVWELFDVHSHYVVGRWDSIFHYNQQVAWLAIPPSDQASPGSSEF